jgi:hypothetical protein
MSLEDQLHDYFKEYDDKGFVIAINGEWGIGKTEFWKRFIEEKCKEERDNAVHWPKVGPHNFYINKPYAYVSLFGIDSLSALKMQIATSLGGDFATNPKALIFQKFKKGFLFLKELRGTYDGLSLTSPRLVEEIIFHGVKDAIICLDDFERLSKSLDIKDVMGLINFLKVENNCQIVLVMHDDQLKDDAYKGYKEKVFDELLTIPSVLPLLQGMDYKNDRHKEVFIKFYECLGINNFRFYKKVERTYKRFEQYLPESHSDFISNLVLERIFEGVLITDIPNFFYSWDGKKNFEAALLLDRVKESEQTEEERVAKETYGKLRVFSKNIGYFDDWDELFKTWFAKGIIDSPKLDKLIKNELSAIEKQDATERVSALHQKRFRDLNVDGSFSTNFHEQALRNINYTSLTNLDFYCQILEMFDRKDLALILENKIQQSIIEGYNSNPLRYKNQLKDDMFYKPGRFDDFIKDFESKNINLFKTSLLTAVDRIVNKETKNLNDIEAIENSNKDDWRALILHDFATLEDRCTVHEMISRMSRHESEQLENGKLKQWIIEILEEKYPNGTEFEGYRRFLISQLDTLGK